MRREVLSLQGCTEQRLLNHFHYLFEQSLLQESKQGEALQALPELGGRSLPP